MYRLVVYYCDKNSLKEAISSNILNSKTHRHILLFTVMNAGVESPFVSTSYRAVWKFHGYVTVHIVKQENKE